MENERRMVLGLDVGTASVGWALLEGMGSLHDPQFTGVVAAGVRLFPQGADETGEPPSAQRRAARLRRRQTLRRTRRIARTLLLLQRSKLLSRQSADRPAYRDERHEYLVRLDQELSAAFASRDAALPAAEQHRLHQLLPYRLRAESLDRPLSLAELGRVFLHLAQRRGFQSNRRSDRRADKELTDTKRAMEELEAEIQASGARTLGEFFFRFNPMQRRIRTLRTRRRSYETEFEAIWSAQERHHPAVLTADLKRRLHHALFFQRPLRSMNDRIGRCELEPRRKRALLALPVAQRFRLLQKLSDLRVAGRPLSSEQRALLLCELEKKKELSIERLRKLLDVADDQEINLGAGGETKLPGDETAAKMLKAMGPAWRELSADVQERLVVAVAKATDEDQLRKRLIAEFALSPKAAAAIAENVHFDDRRAALSADAMRKLVPLMDTGIAYATARKHLYPSTGAGVPLDRVPLLAVKTAGDVLRNPLVRRTVAQVRRVVNAIVTAYGKPDLVRIEFARDLKRGRRGRAEYAKRQRDRERERARMKERLLADIPGLTEPDAGRWTDKALLWEECRGTCPYTGRPIEFRRLVSSDVEIEHIIPLSRSLDDSYLNKTLCFADENRNRKRNKTPHEAYGATPRWDEILDNVRRFRGDLRREKLWRFQLEGADLEQYLADFSSRQLTDTAYAARLAADQVATLYGGITDAQHQQRVQTRAGGVTAHVRRELGMSRLLGSEIKTREDHRHHAVDALAVALTGQRMVQRLSRAAEAASALGRRRFAPLDLPWPAFNEDAQNAIDAITPSFRVDLGVRGALHNDSHYAVHDVDGERRVSLRIRLDQITKVDDVIDPLAREAIRKKLVELNEPDPAKAFADPSSHPLHPRSGLPIHRVRCVERIKHPLAVGHGSGVRHVKPGENHHLPIFGLLDSRGVVTRWQTGAIVSKFEAAHRVAGNGNATEDPGERRLLFNLHKGDILAMDGPRGAGELVRVLSLSEGDLQLWPLRDVAPPTLNKDPRRGQYRLRSPGPDLQKRNARKVTIDVLGTVRRADRKALSDAPHP